MRGFRPGQAFRKSGVTLCHAASAYYLFLIYDLAVLDRHAAVEDVVYILCGVVFEYGKVGLLARLYRAEDIVDLEQAGRVYRRSLDGLEGGQPGLDHEDELVGRAVMGVIRCTGIGAAGYLHTGLIGLLEGGRMGGVDDLGMMLVARIAVDDAGLSVPVRCTYIGSRENEPATQFDHQTLKESVGFHVAALGGFETDDEAASALELVVLSAPDDEAKAGEYAASLREKLSDNLSRGVPTVWIDASANGCGGLNDELLAAVPLGSLLGYSGFCDLAIVAGAGVSQGFARYAYLASGAEKGADADQAFVKSLAVGLVLGGAYKTDTRPVLDPFIRELGLDPNNILGTAEQRAQIQKKLEDTLLPACASLMQNRSRSRVISDLSGGTSGPFSVSVRAPYLPWSRTFESCFTIDVQSEPPA